jgi:hypothetical protein
MHEATIIEATGSRLAVNWREKFVVDAGKMGKQTRSNLESVSVCVLQTIMCALFDPNMTIVLLLNESSG